MADAAPDKCAHAPHGLQPRSTAATFLIVHDTPRQRGPPRHSAARDPPRVIGLAGVHRSPLCPAAPATPPSVISDSQYVARHAGSFEEAIGRAVHQAICERAADPVARISALLASGVPDDPPLVLPDADSADESRDHLLTWVRDAGVHRVVAAALRRGIAPGGGALADLKQLQDRGALGALLRTPALNEALVELLWPAVQTLQRAAAAAEPLTEPLTEPPHKSAASAAVATKVRFADLVAKSKAAQASAPPEASDAHVLHDKFAESAPFTLAYTNLPTFYAGLEGRVGQPSPNLRLAMRSEHCSSGDSTSEFTTGNYGVATTPETEWHAVVNPKAGLVQLKRSEYPAETRNIEEGQQRAARLKPLEEYQPVLEQKNEELKKLGEESLLLMDELLAGRLYTGPMVRASLSTHASPRVPEATPPHLSPPQFEKYNLVCRASIDEAPPFMKANFEASCKGNKYTTTLHGALTSDHPARPTFAPTHATSPPVPVSQFSTASSSSARS